MSAPIDRDSVVEDEAPASDRITAYDERHYVTYLRLLDVSAEDADWKEVARIVLRRDPDAEELRTYRCWQSHLARAEWMTKNGYKQMLRGATANRG